MGRKISLSKLDHTQLPKMIVGDAAEIEHELGVPRGGLPSSITVQGRRMDVQFTRDDSLTVRDASGEDVVAWVYRAPSSLGATFPQLHVVND
jgi:hypothetical protein